MRTTILPLLVLSLGVSGLACSSYEKDAKLSPPKKDVVTASYKVKAETFIPSNAFACAAQVSAELKTPVKDANGAKIDNDKRTGTVTIPTEIFNKAKADLTVGRVVALAGKVGNTTNTTGTSFVVDAIGASGNKTVLTVTFVMSEKAFDEQNMDVDINVGTTVDLPAECTSSGVYIPPAERTGGTGGAGTGGGSGGTGTGGGSGGTDTGGTGTGGGSGGTGTGGGSGGTGTGGGSGGTGTGGGSGGTGTGPDTGSGGGTGPDDPAIPRSGEVASSTTSNATEDGELTPVLPGPNSGGSDLPATTAEDRPFRNRPGLHFEIPPRKLFELEKTFKAKNGGSVTGSVRGDLLAAYIDVVGRLKVDGKLAVNPWLRVGYEAEMEAKILVGIALKLALANANGEAGPVEFIEDVDAKVHHINVGFGTVDLKRRFRIECKGEGTAGLTIKAGAKATGTAFAGARATLRFPYWPVVPNLELKPEFELKVKAEPIFEVATDGDFNGTCSAELRYSLNTWGSADSWIAAKTYVVGDPSPSAECNLWGGLRGDASVNIPVVPTWEPNIFDLKAGVGGGKCSNQNASDVCLNQADGSYCDPNDEAHAYVCSGGALSGNGVFCKSDKPACKTTGKSQTSCE